MDRIEGQWVVLTLEGQQSPLKVPRRALPAETSEGDHLEIELEGGVVTSVRLDKDACEQMEKHIRKKIERLRRGQQLHDDNADSTMADAD